MRFAAIVLSTVSAIALMNSAAFAADLYIPVDEPLVPEVAAESWSGAYVGVHVGYGWGEAVDDLDDVWTWDLEGFIAGGQVGFNHQIDGIVLGVEADLAWTGIEGPSLFNGVLNDEDYIASVNWMSTIRGRAGVDLDGFLVYGTVGLALAELQIEALGNDDSTETHVGYAIGVGVEKKITEDISLKAEYLYSDFGGVPHYDDPGYPVSFNIHTVKAGLNFHF